MTILGAIYDNFSGKIKILGAIYDNFMVEYYDNFACLRL